MHVCRPFITAAVSIYYSWDRINLLLAAKESLEKMSLGYFGTHLSFHLRTLNPKLKPRTQILNLNPKETSRKGPKASHW